MPDRIRLVALIANGALCIAFAVMALASLGTEQPGMVVFLALVAATGGFSWYVIRKAARVLGEEQSRVAVLEQQLSGLQPPAGPPSAPRLTLQGPMP